ncbi:CobW family GTP-binding protein [Paenibacillus pini]|uniref:Metal chaperone n=1 Tax=Paenibacillus pini JCM 16418 TaxID=1236976 RepID=W7YA64_9BACL|nr:GTP-binding protein [Paenibacillus pini]GAF07935.1 metal chaperone [Paenibacillus pini JCM 16418]
MKQITPIYILSGFLGSGKTTLLQKLIDFWQEQDLLPAVIMNEIGDVNLDVLLVKEQVPMTEMLSGCICCTSRGDLSSEIANLIHKDSPDVIVVEATGVANPLEILDGVTEAALYLKIDLKGLITVVDSEHLLQLYREQGGKTYRLMQEQIRCASVLLLNKIDRVRAEEVDTLNTIVASWNSYAPVIPSVKCDVDILSMLGNMRAELPVAGSSLSQSEHLHASHDHVMVYTHYFNEAVDSEAFEELIANLPREVYRAKGILTFSDTNSRFLFQYAFREPDFLKINPQGDVPDVAVFIGEHFSRSSLADALRALENSKT